MFPLPFDGFRLGLSTQSYPRPCLDPLANDRSQKSSVFTVLPPAFIISIFCHHIPLNHVLLSDFIPFTSNSWGPSLYIFHPSILLIFDYSSSSFQWHRWLGLVALRLPVVATAFCMYCLSIVLTDYTFIVISLITDSVIDIGNQQSWITYIKLLEAQVAQFSFTSAHCNPRMVVYLNIRTCIQEGMDSSRS